MNNIKHHTENLANYSFLVTGGAGFIGSNIVEYLLLHGCGKVRVLDNFSTGSRNNIEKFLGLSTFELVEGDIRDADTCRKAVEGIDFISHQAALGSVPRSIQEPALSNAVNISGFLHVMVAARDAAVKRMVYAASSSTYGDHPALPKCEDHIGNPLSPYAVTKYVNELYGSVFSSVYGFHTIGLRYFNVFGPRQNPSGPYAAVIPLFIEAALKNERPFINGDGNTSRDFTFVDNAVQANIRALFTPALTKHEVVNIAVGEATTLNQLWEYICEILDTAILPVYRNERQGDVKHSLADISKAKRILAYHPSVCIREGLAMAVEWYRQSCYQPMPSDIH
jgi:UDP-N-acetylglucosamine/UDP-N-acetylgalactosamine 4-epimerase